MSKSDSRASLDRRELLKVGAAGLGLGAAAGLTPMFAAADDDYVRTDEERERIRERIAKGNVAHVKEFMESIGQGPCS